MEKVINIQKVVETHHLIIFNYMTPYMVVDRSLLVVGAKTKEGGSNQKDILLLTHSLSHWIQGPQIQTVHMMIARHMGMGYTKGVVIIIWPLRTKATTTINTLSCIWT